LVLKSINKNKETKSNGFLILAIIVIGFIIVQQSEPKKITQTSTLTPPQTFAKEKQSLTEEAIQSAPIGLTNNILDNESINDELSVGNLEQATKIEATQNDNIAMVNEAEAEEKFITESEVIKKKTSINEEIEALDFNLLELDTQIDMDMDMDMDTINTETNNIRNQLLYFEQQLGVTDSNEPEWNKAEQMMLNAKIKLKALENRLKLEGDWGKVRLKLDPREQYKKLKFKYQYGF